jgi:sugar lactone lactonase YvrE
MNFEERIMRAKKLFRPWLAATLFVAVMPFAANAQLVTGLEGSSGSAIGPGGALFVTEGSAGRVSRVDPKTGEVTTFAGGFPPSLIGIGGAIDVAFIGQTAYVLVTLIGPDVRALLQLPPNSDAVGIYRVDGPDSFTVIADIGAWAMANPPSIVFPFFVPTGVQYSLEPYQGGFLVTDGHHNRVLRVTLDGEISEFRAFGNIVPTGLDVHGETVLMARAGPIPHHPEDSRVLAFGPRSATATEIATGAGSGAGLLVDVKFGRGQTLYGLSQGFWEGQPGEDGSPANPFTGSIVRIDEGDGSFEVLATGLNIPTSFQFIGDTAYVVTLTGEVWAIPVVSNPPYGKARGQ